MRNTSSSLFAITLAIFLLVSACGNNDPQTNSGNAESSAQGIKPAPSSTAADPASPAVQLEKLENIKEGIILNELNVTDITGKPMTIASRGDVDGELIVVYSPNCEVCHETIPRWIELYRQFFVPRNIPFIALSVENAYATTRSISDLKIPFKVAVMPDVDLRLGYRIQKVPVTMAIGKDGTIKKIWLGNLGRQELAEVIRIFCPECQVNVGKS